MRCTYLTNKGGGELASNGKLVLKDVIPTHLIRDMFRDELLLVNDKSFNIRKGHDFGIK